MEKLFDCYYTNSDGKELCVRYCCHSKWQARRLFFSEIQKGEELINIIEVKDDTDNANPTDQKEMV